MEDQKYKTVNQLLHETNTSQFYNNGYSKDIIDGIFSIVKQCTISKTIVSVLVKINRTESLRNAIIQATYFLDESIKYGICVSHEILIVERLYCILNGIHSIPYCKMCKKPLKNFKIERSAVIHYDCCSQACKANDPNAIEKRVKSYLSRSPEEKLKTKLQTQQTIENRFGNKCFMKSDYFKEKQLKFIKENGGECNVSQIREVRLKVDETNIDRYGNRCNLANEKQKEQKKQTYIKHYGVDHPMKNPQHKQKMEKIFIDTYGVKNPCYLESNRQAIIKSHLNRKRQAIESNEYVEPLFNLKTTLQLEAYGQQYWWQCLECGHVFASHILGFSNADGRITNCPFCGKHYEVNHSHQEYELVNFLRQAFPKLQIIHHVNKVNRHIIPPYELDIYIPEKKIAIEFNGVFWHSKEFMDKYDKTTDNYYHLLNKTILCEQKGIHLIHVYESEWLYEQEKIKSNLINLINGISIQATSYIISLPHDKYPSFLKINGYSLVEISPPELKEMPGAKNRLFHLYDCGQLVFQRNEVNKV